MNKVKKSISLDYTEYSSTDDLSIEYRNLIYNAYEASQKAYVPYSRFNVGAAILLENNEIIVGSNYENSSYPCGICAERSALYTKVNLHPTAKIKAISITCLKNDPSLLPSAPCGLCRQVLNEFEENNQCNIVILLGHPQGRILEFDSCSSLLPFGFSKKDLINNN